MPSENIVSFYFIRSYGPFKLWHNLCEANKKLEIYRPQFDAKSSTKAETLPHAKHHEPALHCFFPFFFFFFFAFFFSRIHLIPFDTFSTISLKSDCSDVRFSFQLSCISVSHLYITNMINSYVGGF